MNWCNHTDEETSKLKRDMVKTRNFAAKFVVPNFLFLNDFTMIHSQALVDLDYAITHHEPPTKAEGNNKQHQTNNTRKREGGSFPLYRKVLTLISWMN